jgi:phosphatidate cytidylyltransferase
LGVGGLLIGATLAALAWTRWRPQADPLFPKQRLRAWWTMVVVFTLATAGGPTVTIAGFAFLSLVALREFLLHLPRRLTRRTRLFCYLAVLVQYWWIQSDWYGMFVVFIPVFLFLYLPTTDSFQGQTQAPLADQALLHWGLMTTVFCLSHAAYLMVLPRGPGLLFFVTVLTEIADSVRILLSRFSWGKQASPLLSTLAALVTALVLGPYLTPLSTLHAGLAGFVLGLAGTLGHANITAVSRELEVAPGGGLSRIESLAYTAPLFFHGYRYFYLP